MNDRTFQAFGDELTKIALYQRLKDGFVNALRDGWHGTPEQRAAGEGQTWFGKGRVITPENRSGWRRMREEAMSLGGATKALPIGGKSLMLLGTGLMAREALRKQDPSGQGRTRAERLSGLAGDTMGGLVGSSLAMRLAPKSGFLAPLVGGMAGASVGRKIMSAPFKPFRHQEPQYAPPETYQNQYMQQPVPANQGA